MIITAAAIKRPVAATVLIVAVFAIGLFSIMRLDVDYLPEITYPMIKVHIWWSGATPDEIETNLAEPVERVLATVDNLDYLESSSIEGMYTLLVNFQYGVDVEEAYQDVIAAMGRAARQLPPDMDPPVIIKADPSQLPVMQVTLSSGQRDLVWLREWADNWLTDRLVAVPGTAGVEVVGGLKREIRVHLDPHRLLAYNLSPAKIAKILYEENLEMFAGRVMVETREIIARTMGEFESIEEINNVVVAIGPNGEKVYLKDVASVEDSHEEMRVNTRFNGKPCVKLNILKQAEANTVTVAQAVKNRLDQLRRDIPGDIRFGYVENQGDYVMGAIKSVRNSAILAAILVIIVVYLFLGRWRQVLVMMVALPVTLLANFFVMKLAGFSVNLFSLGGLVVALGIILDNSIVVLENITRLKAKGIADYALRGTDEVSTAIMAATLTFLAIFLPFLFVPGREVADRLNKSAGITNVNVSMNMTMPEYRIYIDRARASSLGISVSNVASTLRVLIHGVVSTQYREGTEYYDIRVMVPEAQITSKTDLENLVLESDRGHPMYLRDIAEVRQAVGPVEIIREDQVKEVIVRADAAGISVGEAVARAEDAVAGLHRPAGVEYEMGGQAQMMAENQRTMGLIIMFAALFAYVVLAIQFESFLLPLLIMLNIPFALAGAFLALFVTNTPIGVTVLIGLVVMMGSITSQGVVLLVLAEAYRKDGHKPLEAILRAAPIRVRPILMTQLTTVLGIVPLAINLGEGGDMLQPMAIAVIGGLLYSLVLTLFFLPAAYVMVGCKPEAKCVS